MKLHDVHLWRSTSIFVALPEAEDFIVFCCKTVVLCLNQPVLMFCFVLNWISVNSYFFPPSNNFVAMMVMTRRDQ